MAARTLLYSWCSLQSYHNLISSVSFLRSSPLFSSPLLLSSFLFPPFRSLPLPLPLPLLLISFLLLPISLFYSSNLPHSLFLPSLSSPSHIPPICIHFTFILRSNYKLHLLLYLVSFFFILFQPTLPPLTFFLHLYPLSFPSFLFSLSLSTLLLYLFQFLLSLSALLCSSLLSFPLLSRHSPSHYPPLTFLSFLNLSAIVFILPSYSFPLSLLFYFLFADHHSSYPLFPSCFCSSFSFLIFLFSPPSSSTFSHSMSNGLSTMTPLTHTHPHPST